MILGWTLDLKTSNYKPYIKILLGQQETLNITAYQIIILLCFKAITNLKKMKVKVAQWCLTLCDPMEIQSMEFSRPEYWSGQPIPSPAALPNPGIEPESPALQAYSLPTELSRKPSDEIGGDILIMGFLMLCNKIDQHLE